MKKWPAKFANDTSHNAFLRDLLMPQGLPLVPGLKPKGNFLPTNLWIGTSPKSELDVHQRSDTEWDNLVLKEGDYSVLYYCPNYPEVEVSLPERTVKTIFDMFILYRNGFVKLEEVKEDAEFKPQEGSREWWQRLAQETFTRDYNIPFEIVDRKKAWEKPLLLKNWKYIIACLVSWQWIELSTEEILVVDFLNNQHGAGLTIKELKKTIPVNEDAIEAAIFRSLQRGTIEADLENYPLGIARFRRRGHGDTISLEP